MTEKSSKNIKTALVTGAGRRIGRAIALDLAKAGWNVAVHFNHSAAEAEEVVAEARSSGVAAVALAADLSDESAVAALLARAGQALGPVTALVNNASVFEYDTAKTASRAGWDRHMEVNLRAPFVLSQAFAAQLPGGQAGNIINIIDQRVWRLTPEFMTYTLSKAGLWTLTQTLAMALAPHIRVNAIGPGPVLPSKRQTPQNFAAQVLGLPLGRAVELTEICAALRFILATPSMTGQMMALDGGQHLNWPQAGPATGPEE
jgi:NAD(P)-dependent dehydrogenase (short-subunit alcohol dehydrogenase family)